MSYLFFYDIATGCGFDSDEIKDALPDSPTEESAGRSVFSEMQAAGPMYHHDASRAQHDGDQNSSPVHRYPQISPLTPPDHFDLHGYRQPPHMHAPRAGVPRQGAFAPYGVGTHAAAGVVDPASAFPFEGAQLWNMDGAPASPPPMPEFHGFFPPPSHPHLAP